MNRPVRKTLAWMAILVFGGWASAQSPEAVQDAKRVIAKDNNWTKVLSPATDLYPRYIADQRRPAFAVSVARLDGSDIEGASDQRMMLRLGGRYGFLRMHPPEQGGRGIQIDGELGFLWQVDTASGLDVIGWDLEVYDGCVYHTFTSQIFYRIP